MHIKIALHLTCLDFKFCVDRLETLTNIYNINKIFHEFKKKISFIRTIITDKGEKKKHEFMDSHAMKKSTNHVIGFNILIIILLLFFSKIF